MRTFANMAHSEEEIADMQGGMGGDYQPPEYPGRLSFSLSAKDLATLGGEGAEPGATFRFSAMGEVTSIFKGMEDTRIELSIDEFAGEDGKFFDLEYPAAICFCESDLRKMDLDTDCERGDTIHLIGTARLESTSSTGYGGDSGTVQIIEMTFEDESTESREG